MIRSLWPTTTVIKSIVLAGGVGTSLAPLTKYRPVSMVSILNKPLMEHTLNHLNNNGLSDIIVTGSNGPHSPLYKDFFNGADGFSNVRYVEENRPRGTAGAVRDLHDHMDGHPFLAISGNCYTGDIDFDDVLDFHREKGAALTIVVKRMRRFSPEGICCKADGMVEDVTRIHSSRERRSHLESVGIYVFSPPALDHIDDHSYFDIKEQLVPALRKAKLPVYAYETTSRCKSLYTVKDYFDLHRTLLHDAGDVLSGAGMTKIADGIWAGENVTISPQAYLLGPVVIGADSVIGRGTQIIGPTVIGERCTLEKGSLVRESIVGNDAVMESSSRTQYCIVDQGLRITAGESFSNKIVVDDIGEEDASLMVSDHMFHGIAAVNPSVLNSQKRPLFLFMKRFLDIAVSIAGLAVISPLMLAIALAIKRDASGPVFYRQKRCGKGGRDFGMIKFRTMVQNAEQQQKTLSSRNDVDGPMFKLANDPRVTRIGAILRKTSLDELPQLINVLKGDMSLVGPRPLVMNEMKCSPSWRDIRLRVKPGMTGLWQVSGRSEAHFHDWIRYDVHYVMNQCMRLDLRILLKTVTVVLKKVGAY